MASLNTIQLFWGADEYNSAQAQMQDLLGRLSEEESNKADAAALRAAASEAGGWCEQLEAALEKRGRKASTPAHLSRVL